MTRVPIVCYHGVSTAETRPLGRYEVSARTLERQLGLARRLGYRTLTLSELIDAFERGARTRRALVVTFDDGYRDTVTVAAPILDSLGFHATVFVVPELVGKTAAWHAGVGEAAPLATWDELGALRDRGWEVGLHSATHADLTTLSNGALTFELLDATRSLEEAIGVRPRTLAYPYGRWSPKVAEVVRRAGYRAAVAITRGSMASRSSPRFALPRSSIRRTEGVLDFLALLTVGYRVTSRRERGR